MAFLYEVRLADEIKQLTIGNTEQEANEVLGVLDAKRDHQQPWWSLEVEELISENIQKVDKRMGNSRTLERLKTVNSLEKNVKQRIAIDRIGLDAWKNQSNGRIEEQT